LNQTPHSINGANIKNSYTVKVFVKHVGWNQRGEGNEVSIPVTILNHCLQIEQDEVTMLPQAKVFEVREY
jgi:hypothetical protein